MPLAPPAAETVCLGLDVTDTNQLGLILSSRGFAAFIYELIVEVPMGEGIEPTGHKPTAMMLDFLVGNKTIYDISRANAHPDCLPNDFLTGLTIKKKLGESCLPQDQIRLIGNTQPCPAQIQQHMAMAYLHVCKQALGKAKTSTPPTTEELSRIFRGRVRE